MSDDGTKADSVLRRARGTSGRQRRGALVLLLVILAAVGTRLFIDWNTYAAHLGLEPRPDELVVIRKPAFGYFNPPWWRREITTGYVRPQLLAGGVKEHSFAVRNALSDRRDLEPQLANAQRWELQVATRLGGPRPKWPLTNIDLSDVRNQRDLGLYMRADPRIADLVIAALRSGDHGAKPTLLDALSYLEEDIPHDRWPAIVDALLGELKDRDPDIRIRRHDARPPRR